MADSDDEVLVTDEMVEAGRYRLELLMEAEVGLSYAAREVFLSMIRLSPQLPVPLVPR